jgi:23S rRNA (guanosine2251-2'-O)-methyltransferase
VGAFPYVDMDEFVSKFSAHSATILILDEVQDPQNLGNVLRSSECLGAAAIVLSKDRSVPVTASVEKAAAGASAHVPIIRVINLVRAIQQLKNASFWIYAADAGAGDSCYSTDLTGRVGLILGSEGKGIRRLVRENADLRISIPMAGKVASLNVAQSAAILLAESLRQRMVKQAGK